MIRAARGDLGVAAGAINQAASPGVDLTGYPVAAVIDVECRQTRGEQAEADTVRPSGCERGSGACSMAAAVQPFSLG